MDQGVYGTGVVNRVKLSQVVILAILMFVLLGVLGFFSDIEDSSTRSMADLDSDGTTEEYLLADYCLTIKEEGQVLWQSPDNWRIDSFALGDVNNDGIVNLVITLWKTGNFGPVKPFWYPSEDVGYKNHLFVYRLKDKGMKQVWCSSNLDRPIVSFTIQDIVEDNLFELVVEEGQYRKIAEERYALDTFSQVRTAVWRWDEWGFRLISPKLSSCSMKGRLYSYC